MKMRRKMIALEDWRSRAEDVEGAFLKGFQDVLWARTCSALTTSLRNSWNRPRRVCLQLSITRILHSLRLMANRWSIRWNVNGFSSVGGACVVVNEARNRLYYGLPPRRTKRMSGWNGLLLSGRLVRPSVTECRMGCWCNFIHDVVDESSFFLSASSVDSEA